MLGPSGVLRTTRFAVLQIDRTKAFSPVPTDNPQSKKPPNAGFLLYGPPGEIRTPDTQVRSLVLYPAELRAEERQVRETSPLGQVQVGIIW